MVSRRTRPRRPTRRCGSRSTTGAGRACRSSSAPASCCRRPRPRSGWCSSARRGSASAERWARSPEPNELVVKLDPSTGIRMLLDAQRADAVEPEQINLDMEFAGRGRRGPDALRGAAARGDDGDSARFTRQDGVEEAWRVMQPLLAAPRRSIPTSRARGVRRPRDELLAGPRRLARPVGGVMTAAKAAAGATEPQSAAMPSPFPPIADYAFLSDCHTGALVAPDGAVDWLCVPRFDCAERVRHPARPRGRLLPLRALRHQPCRSRAATSPAPTCS